MFYLCRSVIGPMSPYALRYDMYRLCFALILSSVIIFLVSPKLRFASGVNLVASNMAIIFSFLSFVYCFSINLEGDRFGVWRYASPDIYIFSVKPVFNGVLLLSFLMSFVSMIFLIRNWIIVLFNLKGTRNILATYCLVFVSIVIVNFHYRVLSGVHTLQSNVVQITENYIKKIDATEEMTKRHAQENIKSWSANYLRAQFLWDTEREEDALEYYEKALGFLGEEDAEMKNFIEKRIKKIQDERN